MCCVHYAEGSAQLDPSKSFPTRRTGIPNERAGLTVELFLDAAGSSQLLSVPLILSQRVSISVCAFARAVISSSFSRFLR